MVNTNLQEASKELKNNKIFVWNMRGRVQLHVHHEILATDGTHLSELGTKKNYRSIRGALIWFKNTVEKGKY